PPANHCRSESRNGWIGEVLRGVQLGIPRRTFYRWYDRYLDGGPEALADRSSAPSRGTVGYFVPEACFRHWLTNLSPKTTANWVLASNRSRGGRFHSSAAWFNAKYNSFMAASSLGKWPRVRTARRSFEFNASIWFVV